MMALDRARELEAAAWPDLAALRWRMSPDVKDQLLADLGRWTDWMPELFGIAVWTDGELPLNSLMLEPWTCSTCGGQFPHGHSGE